MTRNEFIAETAARFAANRPNDPDMMIVRSAESLADDLEARNVAPWLTPPAPALTDAARELIDAVCAHVDEIDSARLLVRWDRVVKARLAYKESK